MNYISKVWLVWLFFMVFVCLSKGKKSKNRSNSQTTGNEKDMPPTGALMPAEKQPAEVPKPPSVQRAYPGRDVRMKTDNIPKPRTAGRGSPVRLIGENPEDRALHGKLSKESRDDEKEWFK